MKKIAGIRADHLVVIKLLADPTAEVSSLEATVSYMDSHANESVGYAKVNNIWSRKTHQLLANLLGSMEEDVAEHVSVGGKEAEDVVDSLGGAKGLFLDK